MAVASHKRAERDRARDRFLDAVGQLASESSTVVSSVRMPITLRDALSAAVALGLESSPNDVMVKAARERVEVLGQRVALDRHYAKHPHSRPTLVELAHALAELDGSPLAGQLGLFERAAAELTASRPNANADDVLIYAIALAQRDPA